MANLEDVRKSFNDLLGVSGDTIQNGYGMIGDWCMMTVWTGFKNAGASDLLMDGEKTAWVPSCWEWYNDRGLTGRTPQSGALVIYDYNGNGTGDHIEFVDSSNSDGTFNCISGNSGLDYVFAERVSMSGVLGFCYPDYCESKKTDENEEEQDMACIFQPNEESYLVFYDGNELHPLHHPDEVTAINMVYKNTHGGKDIPMFAFGTKDAPWATRFMDAVNRK